ncbi:transmembrane transport protein [Paractinoplanes atraurantiacus]|uniref:Transmembrane protein n=1 Tax=Paractinoplanes atraurantiacus TaxID=1036182 RepID=A0A285IV65_9ACTN|nr:transmembrane transport protein [Actinoplanes atraurantiacus]SNY51577.1 hypothetical protein SAMN05421748_11218 [Actinoplanes atraurantiacus]
MTPEDVLKGLTGPLSLRRRLFYVAVGLAGLTGSALIALLWATEAALPARTQIAFAVLIVIGIAWAGFGGWAVTRRVPLFARDRVVAAWLGMVAWLLFAAGALAIQRSPGVAVVVVLLGTIGAINVGFARRARATLRQSLPD